jgi:soluble lytic murein transglycosylase-like protein
MRLGPRLVIPGTIFGSLFLAFFLLAITAGASYPTPALAAQAAPTPAPNVAEAPQEEINAVQASTAPAESGADCLVNANFPPNILQWCNLISRYAADRGLDPNLVAALILQESGGDPNAYSKSGAVGLMQVMPSDGVSAGFMCINGPCFSSRPSTTKLQDPEFNISYGTKLLADLLAKHGNLREALKAYGPMNVGYYYADIVLGILQNYGK